jgi:hypothetical protein
LYYKPDIERVLAERAPAPPARQKTGDQQALTMLFQLLTQMRPKDPARPALHRCRTPRRTRGCPRPFCCAWLRSASSPAVAFHEGRFGLFAFRDIDGHGDHAWLTVEFNDARLASQPPRNRHEDSLDFAALGRNARPMLPLVSADERITRNPHKS